MVMYKLFLKTISCFNKLSQRVSHHKYF